MQNVLLDRDTQWLVDRQLEENTFSQLNLAGN